jgi:hypothetical protein
VTFNHKNGEVQIRKNCIVERENAFFKSSPVDEYHLPQMNSEKDFFARKHENLRIKFQKNFFEFSNFNIVE